MNPRPGACVVVVAVIVAGGFGLIDPGSSNRNCEDLRGTGSLWLVSWELLSTTSALTPARRKRSSRGLLLAVPLSGALVLIPLSHWLGPEGPFLVLVS